MNAQEAVEGAEYYQGMFGADAFRPEFQHSPQSFEVGGISFSTLLGQTALVTGIAVLGTVPVQVADGDLASHSIEAVFTFPSSSDLLAEDVYSRMREEMVASGLPMLGDEELRAEILDRKGRRGVI